MKWSTRTLLLLTTVFAITFAMSHLAEAPLATGVLMGIAHLIIATSLATPFLCRDSRRPFWTGYAVTTAYVTIFNQNEMFPFNNLRFAPIQFLSSIAPHEQFPQLNVFLQMATFLWTAPLFGLVSGGSVLLWQRFIRASDQTPTLGEGNE